MKDQQPISTSRIDGDPLHVVAIVNPVAGASKQRLIIGKMIAELRTRGVDIELKPTAAAGDAFHLSQAATQHADAVMAIGGDGTVREVAHGLAGSQVPLLVWPTGTENLVAKAFGFRADAQLILDTLRAGRVADVDVGVANGRNFLVVAGIGFDAEIVRRLAQSRNGHITHMSYFAPIWRSFWEHRFPPIRVCVDDRVCWEGRGMVFVGNMAQYAFGMPVVRDARADDGVLDLCILPCRGQIGLLAQALRIFCNVHIEHPAAYYQRVRRVRIESSTHVPCELDGDDAGSLPMDIEIRPAAIRVLVPPGSTAGYNLSSAEWGMRSAE